MAKTTKLFSLSWPERFFLIGCFVFVGGLIWLFFWAGFVKAVYYTFLAFLAFSALLPVVFIFKTISRWVSRIDENAPAEPPSKQERLKLERLTARLTAHEAEASVRQELEDLKANPRPAGTPTHYQGGGTLPGSTGERWD